VTVRESETTQQSPLVVFLIGLGVNIALVLSLRRNFPYEDSVNHLTRWVFMARAWSGHGVPYIQLHPIPSPYLGLDLVGATLALFLSPAMTLRVMSVLVVAAVPVGFYLLLRAVGRANTGWALVGVPVGFGFFAHVGFMSYNVGLSVAMIWLAAWWPYRAALSRARLAALSAGIIGCYLVHLSAPLIVLVVIWIDMLLNWRDPRWKNVLIITATLGVFLVLQTSLAPHGDSSGVTAYGTPWSKIRNVFTPFYVYSYGQAIVAIAAYILALVLFRRTNPRSRWLNTWGLASAGFFLLYLIFPANIPGAGYLDMRWLLPAFLLPFLIAGREGRPANTGVLLTLLAASVLNSLILARSMRSIDGELGNYAAALDRLPPGQSIFPIVADDMRWGPRVLPFRHFAFWYAIDRNGRVPALFNYAGEGDNAPKLSFMPYFEEKTHLYPPPPGWTGGLSREHRALDWLAISTEYDYVIVAGPDARMRSEVGAHTREAYDVGDVAVFKVER
jgi:hypothetical protein